MTALARGSQSFALPATQNTAPVHEYRCLYTHDVRKKAKKWHDGSTRFHTFNKRVMVYDDTKNYIGDLHYRADEEFGEGIELQLDRGVLVEVGERVGETQTDLTGIVHKPHTDVPHASATSTAVRPRPTHRLNNVISQARPKSLLELLGPSQNRHGRATLPLTSPFEQRQVLSEVQQADRPSKRQKLVSGKENDRPSVQKALFSNQQSSPLQNAGSSPAIPRIQNRQAIPTVTVPVPANITNSIIDISSDEDVDHQSKSPVAKVPTALGASNLRNTRQFDSGQKSSSGERQTNSRVAEESLGASIQSSELPTKAPIRPSSAVAASNTGSESSLRPGMTSLKMRSQEPRKKLMYKALLCSDGEAIFRRPDAALPVGTEQEPSAEELLEQDYVQNEGHEEGTVLSNFGFDAFDESDVCELTSRSLPVIPAIQKTPERPDPVPEIHGPSPLFVSQRASQRSPTPARTFIEDDFDIPDAQVETANEAPKENEHNDTDDDMLFTDDDNGDPEPESPCFPYPPPRSKPVAPSSPAMRPPPKPMLKSPLRISTPPVARHTPPSKNPRSFVRSLSENDSPLPYDPRTSSHQSMVDPIEESPIAIRQQILSPVRPAKPTNLGSPKKSSFQRCRSDTAAIAPVAAITPTTALVSTTPVVSSETEEQGPWTSLEAFLLFDKWPTCKEKNKPVFEPLTPVDGDGSDDDDETMADSEINRNGGFRSVLSMANRNQPALIRSAKAVWRDG